MLPLSRTARGVAVALTVLVMLQPVLPTALGQDGHDHSSHDHGSGPPPAQGSNTRDDSLLRPNASPVTPGVRYVRQQAPETHGDFLVWQQQGIGRDWDIMAYNYSAGGNAFPLSTRVVDEVQPTVRGPWVAWEERHRGSNASIDVVVFDVRTGHTIHVPDSGRNERRPTIGGNATVYYFQQKPNSTLGELKGFDLETRTVFSPLEGKTISGGPSAYQRWVAVAEGSSNQAKIVVLDMRNGTRSEVPKLWQLEDGPALGPHGVAWIAAHGGRQRGTYTTLYNESTEFNYMRSGVYPHRNVGQCPNGVVWDQPGSSTTDIPNVGIWDAFVGSRLTFSPNNTDPTCTDQRLIFQKAVPAEDEDLGQLGRIYHLDLSEARLPADAKVRIDPGLARGIYSEEVTFTGTVAPGDAREPIREVYAAVDRESWERIGAERLDDGRLRWEVTVDARQYFSGRHMLSIGVIDDRGHRTVQGFTFYTDTPYRLDQNSLETGVDVPREEPAPFPLNLIGHYQDYQPFYNTVLLGLLIIGAAIYGYLRWRNNQPPPTPEYVAPEDSQG